MNKFKDMDRCPNCGEELISNAIDVGVGYVYEPLHCDNCLWCEGCDEKEKGPEYCSRCEFFEYCWSEQED